MIFSSAGHLSKVLDDTQGGKIGVSRKKEKEGKGERKERCVMVRSAAGPCAIDFPWRVKPGLSLDWSSIPGASGVCVVVGWSSYGE